MIRRLIIVTLLLFTPLLAVPAPVGAVDVLEPGVCEKYKGKANNEKPAVCQDNAETKDNNPLWGPDGILTAVLNVLSVIVGVVAVIVIILAGLKFVTSGSNPQEVAKAREQIIYACIALVIAAVAQALVRFILGKIGT